MTDRPTFQLGLDTRLLIERLGEAEIGETVAYADLTELLGRDVTGEARPALVSARHRLLADRHIVFGTVRGRGLKRLSDVEIVHAGTDALGRARRAARRGIKVVTAVTDFQALPDGEKVRHNAMVSVLGAIDALSSHAATQRIERCVAASPGPLPIAGTMDAFRNGKLG